VLLEKKDVRENTYLAKHTASFNYLLVHNFGL